MEKDLEEKFRKSISKFLTENPWKSFVMELPIEENESVYTVGLYNDRLVYAPSFVESCTIDEIAQQLKFELDHVWKEFAKLQKDRD